ncbi:winged helix-turn-helix transcriptional regulator [Streptomyces coelicoflavus]|uniref:winged helix-turn-helix transcriptional regulator n=1 Tax=Streptomyces coelicoflavus TaxID=285562 RepID=UPI003A8C228F
MTHGPAQQTGTHQNPLHHTRLRAPERGRTVVDRDRRPGWPPRVPYTLTTNGHRLGPVLQALWDWGEHLPTPAGEADPSRTTGPPNTRLRTCEDPSPSVSVGDEVFGQ